MRQSAVFFCSVCNVAEVFIPYVIHSLIKTSYHRNEPWMITSAQHIVTAIFRIKQSFVLSRTQK